MTRWGHARGKRWSARGWRGSALALGLGCLLIGALAALATPGYAIASGTGGALSFSPQSGPVGTQVTVTIDAVLPGPTPYLLSASPTDPNPNTCADGVQLSDAPKIIVMPGQPTITTFTWPSEFFSGAYYLCASPANGQKGQVVWSRQPFTVTSATGVVAEVPGGGVVAGGSFTLTVDANAALGGAAPATITLMDPVQFVVVQVNWAQVAQDGAQYTFTVNVPADAPTGTYEAQVLSGDGSHGATSNKFQVVPSTAVSRGGPRTTTPQTVRTLTPAPSPSPLGTLLVAAIALLLALGAASLAAPLLRRGRRDAHSR